MISGHSKKVVKSQKMTAQDRFFKCELHALQIAVPVLLRHFWPFLSRIPPRYEVADVLGNSASESGESSSVSAAKS